MRSWSRACAVWLLPAVVSCATTEGRPEGPIIDRFEIEGTRGVEADELKGKVVTADSFLAWLPIWGRPEHFDANAWLADQRRIERYYQSHGYYQARVVEEEVKPEGEGHVSLRLKVDEGQPTTITRFEVLGLKPLSDEQRADVLEKLPLKRGRIFLEEEWLKTRALLEERLHKLGFAGATLQPMAQVDVDKQIADLEVQVSVGQRYKFGRIYVSPPEGEVSRRLIYDQASSEIEEGDWYDPDHLEEAQARVFKMGVFAAVTVERAALDQQTGTVPVVVSVREAPFHSWRVGGGIGGDPLRNEIRGSVLYENRNFFGGTRRLTLRGRAGYAFLSGSANSGFFAFVSVFSRQPGSQHGPFGQLSAEIEQPHFLSRALAVQLTVEPSYQLEPAFRAGGGSATLALVWRPTSHFTGSLGYSANAFLLSAAPALGAKTTQFVGCGLLCVSSVFELNTTWDRRDNVLEPHRGFYAALGAQLGGNTLASGGFLAFNFVRLLPELRGYWSFFDDKLTVAGRARMGMLFTRSGSAPIAVRFFSGGNDMRGFSSRRLAPYDVVPRSDCHSFALDAELHRQGSCPGNGEVLPVGGNTLLEGTFELRWNIWQELTVAGFADLGYVTLATPSVELFAALNVAVGVGIRYRTPIGPIRVDFAARLPVGAPLERAGVLRQHAVSRGCFFGLGAGNSDAYAGSPEGQCAFHVSVGEAF